MIRRRQGEEFLLIAQTDHAYLAAEIAARLGNDRFAQPQPRQAVMLAIALHDAGWSYHDANPTINGAGEPCDVFETPHDRALAIWSFSTQTAMAADAYAGLLVSLHGLELCSHIKPGPTQRAAMFALLKFQHNQIEIQEDLRKKLGMETDQPLRRGLSQPGLSAREDQLRFNSRLLEFSDQLSLNLCFDEARIPTFQGLHAQPGKEATTLIVRRLAAGEFQVAPWPFDSEKLKFSISAKRVAARKYQDDDDLRFACNAAKTAGLAMILAK